MRQMNNCATEFVSHTLCVRLLVVCEIKNVNK